MSGLVGFSWVPGRRGVLPVMIGIFVLVRLGECGGFLPGWGRGYLDDLLCLPLVLTGVLTVQRLAGAGPRWRLPLSHGILALGSIGIFFEICLPRLRPAAVADPLDLVMYAAGLAVFQILINRPGGGSRDSCRSSGLDKETHPSALLT